MLFWEKMDSNATGRLLDLGPDSAKEITIASYPVLQIMLGILYFIIIFLALFGNALVITAITIVQERKSATHWLLVSLAYADLTVTVLVMPFALAYDVLGHWQYGSAFCRFWMCWDVMCCTASLQHLFAIAWDRYVAITDPFEYSYRMNLRRIILIIIAIWVNSAVLSFFPIFTGLSAKSSDTAFTDSSQCFLSTNPIYALISASVSFYIPFLGMGYCYFKILIIILEKISISDKQQRAVQAASQLEVNHCETSSLKVSSTQSLGDLKATKTLGILFGVLFFCWWPFFIVYWINAFTIHSPISQPLQSVITWLGYLNSTMNPVIYSWNPVFRADYRQVFSYIFSLFGDYDERREMQLQELNPRMNLISACSTSDGVHVMTQEDIEELESIFWPKNRPLLERTANGIGPDTGREPNRTQFQTF